MHFYLQFCRFSTLPIYILTKKTKDSLKVIRKNIFKLLRRQRRANVENAKSRNRNLKHNFNKFLRRQRRADFGFSKSRNGNLKRNFNNSKIVINPIFIARQFSTFLQNLISFGRLLLELLIQFLISVFSMKILIFFVHLAIVSPNYSSPRLRLTSSTLLVNLRI